MKPRRYMVHSAHPAIDTWVEETNDGVWMDAGDVERHLATYTALLEAAAGMVSALGIFANVSKMDAVVGESLEELRAAIKQVEDTLEAQS